VLLIKLANIEFEQNHKHPEPLQGVESL